MNTPWWVLFGFFTLGWLASWGYSILMEHYEWKTGKKGWQLNCPDCGGPIAGRLSGLLHCEKCGRSFDEENP